MELRKLLYTGFSILTFSTVTTHASLYMMDVDSDNEGGTYIETTTTHASSCMMNMDSDIEEATSTGSYNTRLVKRTTDENEPTIKAAKYQCLGESPAQGYSEDIVDNYLRLMDGNFAVFEQLSKVKVLPDYTWFVTAYLPKQFVDFHHRHQKEINNRYVDTLGIFELSEMPSKEELKGPDYCLINYIDAIEFMAITYLYPKALHFLGDVYRNGLHGRTIDLYRATMFHDEAYAISHYKDVVTQQQPLLQKF